MKTSLSLSWLQALLVISLVSLGNVVCASTTGQLNNSIPVADVDVDVAQTTVFPHWLPGGKTFWYRHKTFDGGFEFIFADALAKTRKKAFNHQSAAQQLQQLTKRATDAENLPFEYIDPALDASSVRFHAHDKTWRLGADGTLVEWNGPIRQGKPKLLVKEASSTPGGPEVHVEFLNHASGPIKLEWIGFDGEPVFIQKINVRSSSRHPTYAGHVWRLSDEATGAVKAVYSASESDGVAVIDDNTMRKVELGINEQAEYPKSAKRQELVGFPRVFIRDFNVWIASKANDEQQVTTNGNSANPYDRNRIHISPDKQSAVVWQYTPEQDHKVTLVESSPKDQLQPKLRSIQYLKPGDRVQVDRPRLFNLNKKTEVPTNDTLFKNPYEMRNIGWSTNGNEYRFLFNERGHQHLRVLGMNRDGSIRTLVEESSKTFIDYSSKLYRRLLNETNELLWASERDGWNHLYLYDLDKGIVKNQITKGEWLVRSVENVDVAARRIWFRGYGMVPGQDPYFAHLARVNFDGSGLTILTQGNGTHTWEWSPDRQLLTDTWSRVDLPPTSVLRDAETGKLIMTLEESNRTSIREPPPEIFTALGRDGKTLIYGIIVRPTEFNPTKKYPVLEDIYAGPQDYFVPKAFSKLTGYREWANEGYIVVKIDGMGTNWRHKAFHDVCYKNLQDAGFPDRRLWLKAAAETRPWMDLSRLGIKGGSAGGQNAAGALLFHNDFYKVAAADSGCHDNRMDKIWWNEQWMGYPIDKSYEDSSNVVHAGKLQGNLMLIVGDLDDNVDPSSTLQVVNALNVANKDYELLFIPGGGHGCGSTPYGMKRQRAFFRRHLLEG
jgi:dipeptidyl-peptidase 4